MNHHHTLLYYILLPSINLNQPPLRGMFQQLTFNWAHKFEQPRINFFQAVFLLASSSPQYPVCSMSDAECRQWMHLKCFLNCYCNRTHWCVHKVCIDKCSSMVSQLGNVHSQEWPFINIEECSMLNLVGAECNCMCLITGQTSPQTQTSPLNRLQ